MSKIPLKPHIYRELVNKITNTFQLFANDEELLVFIRTDIKRAMPDLSPFDVRITKLTMAFLFAPLSWSESQSLRSKIQSIVSNYVEPKQ